MSQKRFVARLGVDNNNQTLANVANPVLGTDAVNKNITDAITGFAQSSFDKANTASANTLYISGVDAQQNTNIQLAYNAANTALSSALAYAIALG